MGLFSALLLIIILVVILVQHSSTSTKFQKLENELKLLRRQLLNLTADKKEVPQEKIPEKPKPVDDIKPHKIIFTVADDKAAAITPAVKEEEPKEKLPEPKPATVEVKQTIEPPKQKTQPVPSPGFFERHPDLEKFIGENLVSKIGIAVLVLAIGFFVKYSIDKNWIGPVARVANGIAGGAILILLAHRFCNKYRGFSSVLAGGGIAVFYFTITLAFQQFHLFSQTTAFVVMVVITVFAVALALLYDKQELGIIALLGGFLAPLLVSTGSGNYKVLFSYLIILNSGLLVIAYYKAWRLLNLLSFIFTTLMFASWLLLLDTFETDITYRNGFVFATVFYLLFFIINIAHNIKEKKKFIASDFGILLANTSLYFAAGIFCLNEMDASEWRGAFSAGMGVFNLCISFLLFRKRKVDTNILYLLIGITLTFISITAPIQLNGNYITLFWASEAVLLYWLFTKSSIRIILYSATLIWILMLVSLVMDWLQLYGPFTEKLPVMVNKGFITTICASIATYILYIIRRRETEFIRSIAIAVPGKNFFLITALVLLFAAGALEINHQFINYYPGTGLNIMYLLLFTVIFINILVAVTQKVRSFQLGWHTAIMLLVVCICLYLACSPTAYSIQRELLLTQNDNRHFLAHWVTAALICIVVYRFIRLLLQNKPTESNGVHIITWLFCIVAVTFLSIEIHLAANQLFFAADNPLEEIRRIYIKTGLPILWGLCSFAFMWLGMHFKYRTLRIISLSLFTLTLLKLFIFDIRNIPAGGKIAAFFCLGVLLLVVSFMYQRLKKIIIDEEKVD